MADMRRPIGVRSGYTPRTILHIFHRLEPGGAELRTIEAIESIQDSCGLRFVFLVLSGCEGSLAGRAREAGIDVTVCHFGWRFPRDFARILRAKQVQVVHAHAATASGYFLVLAALFGVGERIAHFRSDGDGARDSIGRRLKRFILRLLIRATATKVLAVSPAALLFAGQWSATDPRCEVIPSGLITPRLPSAGELADLRSSLRIGPDQVIIAHVGRDHPVKNRVWAVRVWLEIVATGTPATLVMLGRYSHEERSNLMELVPAHLRRHVRLLGQVVDVDRYLASSNLLLLTSVREGLPGAVLQSVAVGTPVVSTDLPGSRWIQAELGGVELIGLDAPARDWANLARSTLAWPTMDDRRGAATRFAESRFAMDKAAERFLAIWSGRE